MTRTGRPTRAVVAGALAAGVADAATGALLLAVPRFVAGLAGSEVGETVWLRWVGAFVLAVGIAYLYPFSLPAAERPARLAVVAEVTALARGAVALFVTAAVGVGVLGPLWLGVAAYDGALAAVQVELRRRGVLRVL